MARIVVALTVVLAAVGVAAAQASPIPDVTAALISPKFEGSPWSPKPVRAAKPPRHPFMARNGRSNIHDDAYQTDTYRQSGPLGNSMETTSTVQFRECGSVTFDGKGRIVTICVGLDRPVLTLMDPHTLAVLASMDLPPRPTGANVLTDFSGGGYFYLDNKDRAVFPTGDRHLMVVAEGPGPSFVTQKNIDLSGVVPQGDGIISALPDWKGLVWFVSKKGVVGTVSMKTGTIHVKNLAEPIGNSFAVDETGGVFIVSDAAMYRFRAGKHHGKPLVSWRRVYRNIGVAKPGQTEKGSGTTPTILGRYVAITDNADPMNVVVYRRAARLHRIHHRRQGRLVCRQAVFSKGAGSTDNSLIGAGRSMVVENNYGYTGLAATELGRVTQPGIERVDIDRDGHGCHKVWHSDERAPSVVPKLSLGNGLVYTYTKPQRSDSLDPWYLTALDFRSGRTVWSRLSGTGFSFNNNYAPVSIGPDGTAYVGVLGGLTLFRDAAQ